MNILDKYYSITGGYLKKQVKRIENKTATTKNRYADYLHLLSVLIGERIPKNIARDLIIRAGGNAEGINAAMKIINL